MNNKKEKKIYLIHLPLLSIMVVIALTLIIGTIIGINIVTKNHQQESIGVQFKDHIGYFDEDNAKDKPKITSKKDKQTAEKTYESFLKSTNERKKANKNIKNNKKTKVKAVKINKSKAVKLTSAQKQFKKHPELNNGEWLPPIKD